MFLGAGVASLAAEDCAPSCLDEEVDDIKTLRLVADIGLGVGVAGAVSALVVGIVSSSGGQEDAAVSLVPVRDGVGVGWRF